MSDACGCSDETDDRESEEEAVSLWRVTEIRAALLAAVVLAAAWLVSRNTAPDLLGRV